jgi:hypothetical protein
MAGDSHVRHCMECKLNVYNLSEMTRAEAERLIASREGRLCVRFYRRADGTILTRNCPSGLQAISRRVSRVAGAVFSAMISLVSAYAQAPQKSSPDANKEQASQKGAKLTFTVVDASGAVISDARFSLRNKDTGTTQTGKTHSNGTGSLSSLAPGPFVLRIESPGFKVMQYAVTIEKDKPQALHLVMQVSEAMVGVVVVSDQVDHDDSQQQTTFSANMLQNLPIR